VLLGNRRFVGVAVLGAVVALALAGCSSDYFLGSTNGEAVAIGQQALGFTSSGGSSAGWTSPISCPAGFEEGLRSSSPATDTIVKVDPTTVTGPASDPKLTTGYIATCAYRVSTATTTIIELAFFDMDDSHVSAIATKLKSDGFVPGAPVQSTDSNGDPVAQTIYSNGSARIVMATVTVSSTPALLVAG
jgi:hypothetical protein